MRSQDSRPEVHTPSAARDFDYTEIRIKRGRTADYTMKERETRRACLGGLFEDRTWQEIKAGGFYVAQGEDRYPLSKTNGDTKHGFTINEPS